MAFAIAAILIVGGAQIASATTTPQVCDPAPSKYWCFSMQYTANSGYVSAEYLNFSGGLGGSADYFYVWRDEYWRQDPSTLTWYYLTGYAPSGTHSDTTLGQYWYTLGNGGYFISDWAEVSAQMRLHKSDNSGFFCGETQDFYLSSPSGAYTVNAGGGGPC